MSERRSLLDPMYKISEEDSQDEEVIENRTGRVNGFGLQLTADTDLVQVTGVGADWRSRKIKWSTIMSEIDTDLAPSTSGSSEDTDDSRETSSDSYSVSGSQSSGSSCCSLCDTTTPTNSGQATHTRQTLSGQDSTTDFLPLSDLDLELYGTRDNLRIIEVYSDPVNDVDRSVVDCQVVTGQGGQPTGKGGCEGSLSNSHDPPSSQQLSDVYLTLNNDKICKSTNDIPLAQCILGILPSKWNKDQPVCSRGKELSQKSSNTVPTILKEDDGIKISAILPNTPAAMSDLKLGDWICSLDNISVTRVNFEFVLASWLQSHQNQSFNYCLKVGVARTRDTEHNFHPPTTSILSKSKGDDVTNSYFFVTIPSSHKDQGSGNLQYVWPPRECPSAGNETWYKSLVQTVPVILTMFSTLIKPLTNSSVRIRINLEASPVEVECWSDDGGLTVVMLINNIQTEGNRYDPYHLPRSSLVDLIKNAYQFHSGTISRAFTPDNHPSMTRLLDSIFKTESLLPFLPHFPRRPVHLTAQKLEQIYDELLPFDVHPGLAEETYSIGVSVYSKGQLLATTLGQEVTQKSYCWLLGELGPHWTSFKRLLVYQQVFVEQSVVTIVIGKEDLVLQLVINCPESLPTTAALKHWKISMATKFQRLLTLTRKITAATDVHTRIAVQPKAPRSAGDSTSLLGTAWTHLKNKVIRKSTVASPSNRSYQEEDNEVIFLAKIDRIHGVILEAGAIPREQSWTPVHKAIPQVLSRLKGCQECGVIFKLAQVPATVWLGGRSDHSGTRVLACVLTQTSSPILVETLDKILDKVQHL